MADHRQHQLARRELVDGRCRKRATIGPALAARVRGNRLRERHGRLEVAEQHQVVHVRGGGLEHVAPLVEVFLDAQQVEQQLQIEAPDFGVRDGGHPRRDALGRIVADPIDVDRLRASGRELARVLRRHELLVPVREQHLAGAMPEIAEPGLAAKRRLRDLGFGELHQRGPAFGFRDERLERLRKASRGAALRDDRPGDEPRDGLVAHAIDHLPDHVDAALGRLIALREQFEHDFRRQPARGGGRVGHHRVEPSRVGVENGARHQAEEANERLGLSADAAVGRAFVDAAGELAEARRIAGDLEQRLDRFLVEIDGVALEAVAQDRVPRGVEAALPFAQHLGVVDLADLQVLAAGRAPQAAEAALEQHLLGRPRDEQQEAAPRGRLGAVQEFQFAHQVVVQQLGELAHRRVVAAGCAAVDRERAGLHGDRERSQYGGAMRRLHQARQRARDGRMAVRIERDRPRRGLACAGERDQAFGDVGGERLGRSLGHQSVGVNAWDL